MQEHIIEGGQAVRQPHLMAAMGRLRHDVFKNRLGWDVHSVQGIEFDQFDIPDAIYGAVSDDGGEMEGCFRLLPTEGTYMLRDVFPQLLHGATPPVGRDVWESSRFAVLPSGWRHNAKSALIMITARLLMLQLAYCLERGVSLVVSVTDIRFEKMLRAAGLACERFGPPLTVGNTTAVAGWMLPTDENLARVEAVHDRMAARAGAETVGIRSNTTVGARA